MSASATGQLSRAEFEAAMRLMCAWWHERQPQAPSWVMQAVVLPVVGQVAAYARLERVLTQPAAAAVAGSAAPEQQHQQQLPAAVQGADGPAGGAAEDEGGDAPGLSDDEAAWLGGAGAAAHVAHAPPPQPHGTAAASGQTAAAAAGAAPEPPPSRQQQQQQQAAAAAPRVHEYSIVWHESYQVPVLHLRGFLPDGRPLSLAQLLADLPQLASCHEQGPNSWTTLTATEHPVSRVPCFMLHPCQTAARMQLMLQQDHHNHNHHQQQQQQQQQQDEALLLAYAIGWLSFVAPLLGLAVPLG